MTTHIKLTPAEIQSGHTRQKWAEGLIEQLPPTHDGRNSWLTNYGTGEAAKALRMRNRIKFDSEHLAALGGHISM